MSKARNYDEWFDAVVCRPLAKPVARFLGAKTALTANQLTGIGALVGAIAGVFFAIPYWGPLVGVGIFFVMMVLDCADGELARIRGGGSWQGRILDGSAEFVSNIAVHVGMLVYLGIHGVSIYGYTLGGLSLFAIALTAGMSMGWNAAVFDGFKQDLKPGSPDHHLDEVEAGLQTWWDRALFKYYKAYLAWTSWSRGGNKGRTANYNIFRAMTWAGPTNHYFAILIAGVLSYWYPLAFLVYFGIAVFPANALTLVCLYLSRRATYAEGVRLANR